MAHLLRVAGRRRRAAERRDLGLSPGTITKARTPIHSGEILVDDFEELGLSAAELARRLDVPANRISQIIAGKRNITADTALRLGRYFGTSPDLWMNLQKTYELDLARAEIGAALERLPQRPLAEPGADSRHP